MDPGSLPGWARDGGAEATAAIIRDPASRARLNAELRTRDRFLVDDWDDQVICKVNRRRTRSSVGRTIGDIARERGQAPIDTALDLVLEDGQYWIAPTIKGQGHLDR